MGDAGNASAPEVNSVNKLEESSSIPDVASVEGKSSTAANMMIGTIKEMDPADREAIKKELCTAASGGGDEAAADTSNAASQGGGRRRSKRRYGKKGAKKSRKGAKKSQNGGRRSSKNRRKHSRRRKH
jgi:hypothetical protein